MNLSRSGTNGKQILHICILRDCTHWKPYQTKPRHFRPIYGPFWPIFGAKVPKTYRKGFQGVQSLKLKYICIQFVFHWSRFWKNSLYLETLLTTCGVTWDTCVEIQKALFSAFCSTAQLDFSLLWWSTPKINYIVSLWTRLCLMLIMGPNGGHLI